MRARLESPERDVRAAPARRRLLVRASAAGVSLAAVGAAVAALVVGFSSRGPGVESAAAAVEHAAGVTATSAERSGSVDARITHGGDPWTDVAIQWHGSDLSLQAPGRTGKVGSKLLVVDGMMYGIDPEDGAWIEFGPTSSIDPDSGTTPDEYLAAARDDVSGDSLRRIAAGMNDLTVDHLDDGSRVYRGTVRAGLVAHESGFKDGQLIRVFPFGFAANGAAADPDAPLDVAITVAVDDVVRQIDVRWGTWRYAVQYDGLGATPAPVAPENARPLKR